MKERVETAVIFPLQLDLSLIVVSHVATGKLNKFDPKASSVLNNISGPLAEFQFANEDEANRTVVDMVGETLDFFWKRNSAKNAKEKQLMDGLSILRRRGLKVEDVKQMLSLHFVWSRNPQKVKAFFNNNSSRLS